MKSWDTDKALSNFTKLLDNTYSMETLSESDTRSKLIDYILLDCLGWSEDNIIREERCVESGTFLDYKLSTNMPLIIIEAKKNSVDFQLPTSSSQREYKIGGVLSSCKNLLKAMIQARDYAISKGITFCVVTNGNEFVFFRAQNQQGIEWVDHRAIVFRSLKDIEKNFDSFCKLLSKSSIEIGILQQTLRVSSDSDTGINKFKTLDTRHLTRPRNKDRNPLFPFIDEIVHRVFQDLASIEAESEVLEHCYVDSPKKSDKCIPYMDRETKKLSISKSDAGDFQKRITSTLKAGKTNHTEVILLIGSVGVGKSTFIQRFRKVLAKKEIDEKGIWIYLNFKHFSDTGESLDTFIFNQIDQILTSEYSNLGLGDWTFLKQAYHSEYEKLKRGSLAPLFNKDPEEFEIRFGDKVDDWSLNEREKHFTNLLSTASKRLSKSVFLVFDNADQLNPETQNKIFLSAQKLAETINCYALIAMREESYWKNRDAGPLNAFHTTAYNVQPASLQQVISKRFIYAKNLIANNKLEIFSDFQITTDELLKVFDRIILTLLGTNQDYINFIESTAARDTRRALDTIASFMISGHTNIEAILKDVRKIEPNGFLIPFHEFLNAIILRDHEVYTESGCDIINIFNVTGTSDASNFNRITVLGKILKAKNTKTDVGNGYVLIEEVINDCHSVGILPETTTSVLTTLNARRMIETETTIKDEVATSKYVRATLSGNYYIEYLAKSFGYLDLIIYETPICNDQHFINLKKIYSEINTLSSGTPEARLSRVKKRIELTEIFIDYLYIEFQKCSFRTKKDMFSSQSINLISDIKKSFEIQKKEIINKAESIFGRKGMHEKSKKRRR